MTENMSDPMPEFSKLDRSIRMRGISSLLASNWWAVALRGLCAIIFGLIALFIAPAAILSVVYLAGAYMLVGGIFGLISAWRAAQADQRWGWLTFEGIINILAAMVAFFWPFATALAFIFMLAAWSIVSGIFMLAAAFQYQGDGKGWLILSALVSVIFGIILFVSPMVSAVVLTWWVGIYAVIFGIGIIILAFKLRKLNTQL
ncbi:HdeD family acid-resistance protein [Microvirga sp. W0021]|uniref:HdeD family acid-resistance protein n=1 Tax=Hohaiivirga grylli TaxID=3133970 RepID=A0ABV0BI62_9HYPH